MITFSTFTITFFLIVFLQKNTMFNVFLINPTAYTGHVTAGTLLQN